MILGSGDEEHEEVCGLAIKTIVAWGGRRKRRYLSVMVGDVQNLENSWGKINELIQNKGCFLGRGN